MPRKKQLKIVGNSIKSYQVNINRVGKDLSEVHQIDLSIQTDDGSYEYKICQDTREPDINRIKAYLDKSLKDAMETFSKVEISEYGERNYLFFKVQGEDQKQYTGTRV